MKPDLCPLVCHSSGFHLISLEYLLRSQSRRHLNQARAWVCPLGPTLTAILFWPLNQLHALFQLWCTVDLRHVRDWTRSLSLYNAVWPHRAACRSLGGHWEGNRCPWNQSQGRFYFQKCGMKCREAPSPHTADYLWTARGLLESWGSPPGVAPTGNTLPATWQWHLDILFFAPLRGEKKEKKESKLDLFGDHMGFDACCVIRRCGALPLLCPCAYYRFH